MIKYNYNISQAGIMLLAQEEGLDITTINADILAFMDFLTYFANIKNVKTIMRENNEYIWLNYAYAIKANPILNLYNQKIKRYLDVLESWGLIKTIKDNMGQIYYTFGENFEKLHFYQKNILFDNSRENFTHAGKNLPTQEKFYPNNNKDKSVNLNLKRSEKSVGVLTHTHEHKPKMIENVNQTKAEQIANRLYEAKRDRIKHFTLDNLIEWLTYLEDKLKFKGGLNEMSCNKHLELLIEFGENAIKAIDNSICKNLAYPALPFNNSASANKDETSSIAEPIKDNTITRAGINLGYKPNLLVKSNCYFTLNSKGEQDYLDYKEVFWDIVREINPNSNVLDPYNVDSNEREVREYLNEAMRQRKEFLLKNLKNT